MFSSIVDAVVQFGILAWAMLIACEVRALVLGVMAAVKHPDVLLSRRKVEGVEVTEFVPGKISRATRRQMAINSYMSRSLIAHEMHYMAHKRKPSFRTLPSFFMMAAVGVGCISLGVSQFDQMGFSMAAAAALFLSTEARRSLMHARKYEEKMTELRTLMLKAV